ncbi:uncharacterized protein LOC131148485 isoform X6 [Malania oleifera]|uniref:uncharacterized protein LOC131148485 isoform X6 n=1 Tax=Malania oleifera TaxID=397392 RepID=UPI0025AEBC6B|nr:uncharacterized protein LOC131148485 isoform X6 [Malania oleifera]
MEGSTLTIWPPWRISLLKIASMKTSSSLVPSLAARYKHLVCVEGTVSLQFILKPSFPPAILEFFKKFIDSISTDLQFVIDDISDEDSLAIGVTWHLEWQGKPFPFSKGCSFYRLEISNGKRQIVYGRDSVEPSVKPGDTTLIAIRAITRLLQQFPRLADWL